MSTTKILSALALLMLSLATFDLSAFILVYISIHPTQLSSIESMLKIYSIPAAFGILVLSILGTGSTCKAYIQLSGPISIAYIQFPNIGFLSIILGIKPTSAIYTPQSGTKATSAIYMQQSGTRSPPTTYTTPIF